MDFLIDLDLLPEGSTNEGVETVLRSQGETDNRPSESKNPEESRRTHTSVLSSTDRGLSHYVSFSRSVSYVTESNGSESRCVQ